MKILLDKIMHEKNLTTRQAEILTGIPRSTISDIMIGKTMPRMDIMEQLAAGLKVSINDLFESLYQYVSGFSDKLKIPVSSHVPKCLISKRKYYTNNHRNVCS